MKNSKPKSDFLLIFLLGVCCAIPLLLLVGGGAALGFAAGYLTGINILAALSLIAIFVFIWLLIKNRTS